MKRSAVIIALIQGTLVTGFVLGVARGWFPLGVPGEWEWLRLPATIAIDPINLTVGGLGVFGYALFAAQGCRALDRPTSRLREAVWVAALAGAAVVAQAVVQEGAPEGYGLAKWIMALRDPGASGYHTVARDEMVGGLKPFLRSFPTWIVGQDSLHIGTHPPGLFVVARSMLDLTRENPDLARLIVDHAPRSVRRMIQATRSIQPIPRADAAALVLTGALTLLGSALTVIPLFLLVRASQPARTAWAAATLWPLLPAALLFQPTADTAFPLLATAALAAAAWASRAGRGTIGPTLAVGSGIILGLGMELTLAFLAVGWVVAVVEVGCAGPRQWGFRLSLLAWTGLGFAVCSGVWWSLTHANPLAVWWINQQHHAAFYQTFPRTRWLWIALNLVETAVALGLASTVFACWGALRPRRNALDSWATGMVLILLTVSGRNLSEVARIWLPLLPPLLGFAAVGWVRSGGGSWGLAWSIGWVGVQALALQALIQVVYPI